MNIEQIRAAFFEAWQTKKVMKPVLAPDRPLSYYNYEIYPLLCLHQLRDVVKTKAKAAPHDPSHLDFDANFGLRFIVNLSNEIKLTREGPRTSYVPAHSDIDSRVYAAGNLYFSADYSRIVKITNKSGHFAPHFSTLVFAIPLIMASGFPLADTIELCLTSPDEESTFEFSHEQMLSLIPEGFNLNEMMDLNASQEIKNLKLERESSRELIAEGLRFSFGMSSNSISSSKTNEHNDIFSSLAFDEDDNKVSNPNKKFKL